MYTKFADFYDRLTHDIHYTRWADYLQSAFRKFERDPKLVLELGCGTGSLAVDLSKRGYDMIAIDNSTSMLNKAYEKAKKADADILFLNQDMRNFELYGTVDAVICLLDSINYITSVNDIKKIFGLVNNYLNPGGLFIFDVNSPYKLSTVLGNQTFYELDEDISWVWENTYNSKSKTTTFDLTFFVKNQDGLYERYDETHKERAFSNEEIKEALNSSGLRLLGEYGDLSFNAPATDEERIFYIAHKA
ncbi:MAG: methyltransferase domain-containing protein [Clostridiaceae bacterium]|jgi:ubiquinone/menaquinone biosynthesis C-methylase UbiE|nr:methyltransferase domain-containing protein [Clostridiaceae bacterium]